jgi:hypothetical protein
MMRSNVDLPEPFKPSTPIFAPGKKLKLMSRRMYRFGGTTLPTRFIVKMYWAMGLRVASRAAIIDAAPRLGNPPTGSETKASG